MNESTNTNQPIRPDFSGSSVSNYNNNLSGPTPLNTEGFGLNNQPAISNWSPGIAPTPGPLNEVAPLPTISPHTIAASSNSSNANFSGYASMTPPIMSVPVPSPSATQYEIKTLASDAEALKASGGAETLPQTTTSLPNITQDISRAPTSFITTSATNPVVAPASIPTPAPSPVPTPAPIPTPIPALVSTPGTTQPAPTPPAFIASATNIAPKAFSPFSMGGEEFFDPVATVTPIKKKGISKTVFIISTIIILTGLGILVILFAMPLFRATPTPVELTDTVTPPAIVVEVTPPLIVEPEPTPPPVIPIYASFFTTPANFVERYTIENITLESLKQVLFASLTGEPARAAARDRMIREVIVSRVNGAPLAFSTFLPTFLPDINVEKVSAIFEDNFTLFVHENRFIGFIAQTKIEAMPAELINFSASLEASFNLGNFYITRPGTQSMFTDSVLGGNLIRKVSFTDAPGQDLHYGWFRDSRHRSYLIVSVSPAGEGMIEAVRRTGLY